MSDIKENILNKINRTIINIIPKNEKILFVNEKDNIPFSINELCVISDEENIDKIKKCLICDSAIDLKIINVPVVTGNVLKSIIVNTIKKHTTAHPDESNTDYIILNKEDDTYKVLVFIKLYNKEEDTQNRRYFTTYHIIENLMKNLDLPDDSSFLINDSDIWFLYSFKNRKFIRRDIYYKEDLGKLKKRNIFLLKLLNEKGPGKKYNTIEEEYLKHALYSLNKNIFKENKLLTKRNIIIGVFGIILLLIINFCEINSVLMEMKKKELIEDAASLNKKYKRLVKKRGISDDKYEEYSTLFSKKSNVNDFFYNLYTTAEGNIKIKTINYKDNKFSIVGECKDTVKLENSFRNLKKWSKMEFTYNRDKNTGVLKFTLRGRFVDK